MAFEFVPRTPQITFREMRLAEDKARRPTMREGQARRIILAYARAVAREAEHGFTGDIDFACASLPDAEVSDLFLSELDRTRAACGKWP